MLLQGGTPHDRRHARAALLPHRDLDPNPDPTATGTGTVNEDLKAQGFERVFAVGEPGIDTLALELWRRTASSAPDCYLSVDTPEAGYPVLVDTFPEAMDLIARWSPAIQSAALLTFLQDLDRQEFIENLARKAAQGVRR